MISPTVSEFLEILAPYIVLIGFIIGLGAVTVIDILGWLGRHSSYWTEATTRTHKVTKPLIWLGLTLVLTGGWILFYSLGFPALSFAFFGVILSLIINGLYLSFIVSPLLISREHAGVASQPLPASWQRRITISFIISFLGWWSLFILVVFALTQA